MNSKFHKVVGRVECGEKSGTLFMVSPEIAITAFHCIKSHIDSSENCIKVNFLNITSKVVLGEAVLLSPDSYEKNLDIAILKISPAITEFEAILLDSSENYRDQPWESFGYAAARSTAGARITGKVSRVVDSELIPRWDLDLVVNTEFKLSSYRGLSGSPIIIGEVIKGIVLIQDDLSIAAVSINKIRAFLDIHNVSHEEVERPNLTFFKKCFQSSLKSFNETSNPNLHVDLEVNEKLNAFFQDSKFKSKFFNHYTDFTKEVGNLVDRLKSRVPLASNIQKIVQKLNNWKQKFSIKIDIPVFEKIDHEIIVLLHDLKEIDGELKSQTIGQSERDVDSRIVGNIKTIINQLKRYITKSERFEKSFLLLEGEAGMGKSHLMVKALEEHFNEGGVGVLFLGSLICGESNILKQLLESLYWEGTIQDFFKALSIEAKLSGKPAIFCVDAINESGNRSLWKRKLSSITQNFPKNLYSKFIISCRSDFLKICIPEIILKNEAAQWVRIVHTGFGGDVFQATLLYFRHYNVRISSFPFYLEDFKRPLFLYLFSRAFSESILPKGTVSFSQVWNELLTKVYTELSDRIDCPKQITVCSVTEILDYMIKHECNNITYDIASKICLSNFSPPEESKSLLRQLISSSLLTENSTQGLQQTKIRFSYERLSDFAIAGRLLDQHADSRNLKKAFQGGILGDLFKSHQTIKDKPGVVSAIYVLVAERYYIELLDILVDQQEALEGVFLESLRWRPVESFSSASQTWMEYCVAHYKDEHEDEYIFNLLIQLAGIPNHPFNAIFLHDLLNPLPIWERDQLWTLRINHGDLESSSNLMKWAMKVPKKLIHQDQLFLVSLILSWHFTSTNRKLRDNATRAAIRLLTGEIDVCIQLLEKQINNNDPYVSERVLAVLAGVATRCRSREQLAKLAQSIYDLVFAETPPTHILLRDYANYIIELANYRNALP
ncbi:MAG: serine protease, partial [Crocinitomicaceae bacterium]|nr:serine protease [Crocinitomicaceae bacterium]